MNSQITLKTLSASAALACMALLISCGPTTRVPTPNPEQTKPLKGVFVNPYKPGSYQHFVSEPNYPKTYGIYKDDALLAQTNGSNSSVRIDLSKQRAVLMNGEKIAMDYPIASGTKKFPTPTGKFQVLEMLEKEKRSNLYGKIYDAEGNVVIKDADSTKDTIPEGGRFEGALMPYWMRITWDGIGMHKGRVPRRPASHGCVRTYYKAVPIVFRKVKLGTPVTIVE